MFQSICVELIPRATGYAYQNKQTVIFEVKSNCCLSVKHGKSTNRMVNEQPWPETNMQCIDECLSPNIGLQNHPPANCSSMNMLKNKLLTRCVRHYGKMKNLPDELAAVGAKGWLTKERCHELVTIYLVHTPSHSPTSPVQTLPLLELPRFWCWVFWNDIFCTLGLENIFHFQFNMTSTVKPERHSSWNVTCTVVS